MSIDVYTLLKTHIKSVLEASALLLGLVNGLMLLKFNLRDKAKLRVEPIHPDVYQWWFRLPEREVEAHKTRAYGFLVYIAVSNRGLRKVSLSSWRLVIRNKQFRRVELKPLTMPEISAEVGPNIKVLPSLGQKTLMFEGGTAVESGGSISGTAYYLYECWGHESWDPRINNGKIAGTFVVKDVFGKRRRCRLVFSEQTLEYVQKLAPGIEQVR